MCERLQLGSLGLEDLPSPYADWPTIRDFALLFDAYGHVLARHPSISPTEACRELAQKVRSVLARRGADPIDFSLDDLRAALFWVHHDGWSDWDEVPAPSDLRYCRRLIECMRERLSEANDERQSPLAGW